MTTAVAPHSSTGPAIAAILAISIAATLFLFWLIYVHPAAALSTQYAFLPALNAILNGLSATALLIGFTFVRAHRIKSDAEKIKNQQQTIVDQCAALSDGERKAREQAAQLAQVESEGESLKDRLADETYAKLLAMITKNPTNVVPSQLKHDLIAYYADPQSPISTKKKPEEWAQVQANLKTLETMRTVGDLDPIPSEVLEGD